MQYCTHICFAIICYQCFNVGMIGQINSGMEPVERCQSTSFHRTGHCPCFVQRRCLGNSLRNQWKGGTAPDSKRGLKRNMILSVLLHKVFWLNFFGDTVFETFGVEQGTLTLVGTSCETVCMPSWPMQPTAMRPRTQTFAYTNWFASQAKPRK